MKANKGERSEFYVFLKILEDKKLFAADKYLSIMVDKSFSFLKVIRDETNQSRKIFDLQSENINILNESGEVLKVIPSLYIQGKALQIFTSIKDARETTFSIPVAQAIMKDVLCTQIKSSSSRKSDLDAVIYDRVSNNEELLGFSIKSMIGGASTLLNAGKTTNFTYKVENIDIDMIQDINNISTKSKIQDRIKKIYNLGGNLIFEDMKNNEFESNLRKIDSQFPVFIANMLLDFFSGKSNLIVDLTMLLGSNAEMKKMYRLSFSDYEYKIKNFLVSIALGMVPSKERDGFIKAHGGYIVVKNNGDVVCYHLYNRDEFLSYLYEITKFESASSTRHDYGYIYAKDNDLYINLNLQIRFLK